MSKLLCKTRSVGFGGESRVTPENAITLGGLVKLVNILTSQERQFIRTVVTHKQISPQQQATLQHLREKYLQETNQK